MTTASILDTAGERLGEGLPGVAAAIVLLVVGIVVARLIGRLLTGGLRAAGLDDAAERSGVHDALARTGAQRSISRAIGTAVRVALTVVVVLASLSLLGLGFLEQSINQAVLLLPDLLVAAVLLLAGVVLGTLVKGLVDRAAFQMDLPGPLGRIAEVVVIAVFGITALAQVGVSTEILTLLAAILISGVVVGFALAFGLGGREVARSFSAGRVVRGSYEVGQTISVAGVRGEIEALEPSATVLRTQSGSRVRVPNHVLLDTVVEVHEG